MIKGVSDVRRLPRLGKIRLGEKRQKDGREYPAALDHFNFSDVPFVEQVYGKNCRDLEIMLPHEELDVFFPQARKAYRRSGLFCKCDDGETATRVRVGISDGAGKVPKGQPMDPVGEAFLKETGEEVAIGDMFELPCPAEECPFTQQNFCKPIGRFLFLVPKVPRFGVYEISTTSFNSIVSLNSYIDAIRNAAGRVSMIPLKLRLVPKQAQVEGKAKTIHHLELVFEGSIQQLLAYSKRELPPPLPKTALPSREELDKELPDDLVPHAGESLEKKLAVKLPVQAPPAPAAPAVQFFRSTEFGNPENPPCDGTEDPPPTKLQKIVDPVQAARQALASAQPAPAAEQKPPQRKKLGVLF